MIKYTQISESNEKETRSLNHSYICAELMRQFFQDSTLQPLPELTLDIENGLTPDICIYKKDKVRPNFFEDILKIKEMPLLVVEVISSNQSVNINIVLEKSKTLLKAGIKAVWIVEPYGHSVFVLNKEGKQLFHQTIVECDGIKVDFDKIFSGFR